MAQRFQMASQSIQQSDDPSYKQSRAAQRIMYGTRRIDASDKQSAQDTTPSGREARARQSGMNTKKIEEGENNFWRKQFKKPMAPEDFINRPMSPLSFGDAEKVNLREGLPKFLPDPAIAQPQQLPGISTADDILESYARGQASGQFNLPNGGFAAYGPYSGPLPTATPPASDMASFLPNTVRPKRDYMSPVLGSPSRWTQ